MADTFSLIHQITGFTLLFRQVVTDGIDIFWVSDDDANSIYKYDVSENTHAKLVDESAFKRSGSNRISLIVFRRNIYVGTTDFGQSLPAALNYVFKVDPTSGTVTEVLSNFPRSVHTQAGGSGVDGVRFRLYSTEGVMVAAYHERRDFPGPPPEPAEFLSMYTSDGTSWNTATDTFSETIEIQNVALTDAQTEGKDFRTLGIYERYPVTTAETIVSKFVTDTWSKVRGPELTSIFNLDVSLFEVAADHFWNADDFGQYTDDWSTYHQPSSVASAMVGLNMPYATAEDDVTNDRFYKLDTSNPPTGRVIDSDMVTVNVATGTRVIQMIRLNSGKVLLFCVATGATFPDWTVLERDNDLPATPNAWGGVHNYSPPQAAKPCSIDADGTFLYIAALFGANGLPVLLKLDTDLLSNATLVFEPGSGTDIGVICGKESANTVWVAGEFDGTNVLEKSTDAGSTFVVKDDGTFGVVEAFAVGPDSDDRVIIADDNVNIEETLDSGDVWTTINSGVGFNINTIVRLATDIKESVFGNDAGAANNIDYSLDSGANMEDYTTGVFPIIDDVTDVIIN